jgi:hypothetical protein
MDVTTIAPATMSGLESRSETVVWLATAAAVATSSAPVCARWAGTRSEYAAPMSLSVVTSGELCGALVLDTFETRTVPETLRAVRG